MNPLTSTLSLLVGLSAFTSVACAVPTGSPDPNAPADTTEEGATDAREAAAELTTTLGGDAEAPGVAPATVADTKIAGLELVLAGKGEVFAVESYEFGVTNAYETNGGALGKMGKANLKPLKITVDATRGGAAPLMSALTAGHNIGKLVLQQAPDGPRSKPVEIATFDTTVVTSMQTGVEHGTVDAYEFAFGSVTIPAGPRGASVTFDLLKNKAMGAVTCGPQAALGPFVHAPPSANVPKGAVRVDRAAIAMESAPPTDKGGVRDIGALTLERFEIEGSLGTTGACAFYYAAASVPVPTVHLDAMTLGDKGNATLAQSWDACPTVVRDVVFSGHHGASPRHTLSLDAGAVIRTNYASNGSPSSTFGWSFIDNHSTASCAP